MKQNRLRFRTAGVAAGIAALALFGLTGCSQDEPETVVVTTPESTTTVTRDSAGTDAAGQPVNDTNAGPGGASGTDAAVAAAVRTAIVNNKQMTGSRVDVVVTGGVATLNGFTQNQQQKALAEKAARDTAGVTSVENKLEIRPTGGAKPAQARPAQAKPAQARAKPKPAPARSPAVVVDPGSSGAPATPPPPGDDPPATTDTETDTGTTAPESTDTGTDSTTPPPTDDR